LGSLVTSSLIRETTENESANEGYKFGKQRPLCNFTKLQIYNSSNKEKFIYIYKKIIPYKFQKEIFETAERLPLFSKGLKR
jgi:alpha-N-acetylglucosamine transferase